VPSRRGPGRGACDGRSPDRRNRSAAMRVQHRSVWPASPAAPCGARAYAPIRLTSVPWSTPRGERIADPGRIPLQRPR